MGNKKKASNFGNGFSDLLGYHRIASLNFYTTISTIRQQIASPNFCTTPPIRPKIASPIFSTTTTIMRPNCKFQFSHNNTNPTKNCKSQFFHNNKKSDHKFASPDVSTTTTMPPQIASPNVWRQQSERTSQIHIKTAQIGGRVFFSFPVFWGEFSHCGDKSLW